MITGVFGVKLMTPVVFKSERKVWVRLSINEGKKGRPLGVALPT